MPEPNEKVLLFLKNGAGKTDQIVGTIFQSDNEKLSKYNGEFNTFDRGGEFSPSFLKKECVIAWRPLPEPPDVMEN